MKNIQVITRGNVVNVSINGKLHSKNCGTSKEADELFKLVLKAKEDPTDANVNNIRAYLNEKTRVAILAGLENDPETGQVFLAGFNTPIPDTLVEVIKEYHEKGYPMEAVINFWKLLMLNPDVRVREDLFEFIMTHDFVLTDNGYMVVYKAVYQVNEEGVDTEFAEFLNKNVLKVKKWSKNPNKYVVYKEVSDGELFITKKKTAEKWDEKAKGVEVLGVLGELHDAMYVAQEEAKDIAIPVFTDMHTKQMRIELGVPVRQERKECDADPRNDCSNGLHCGATKYVESFASYGKDTRVLVCYVNPAHVVAVPQYDHSKFRTCEYFPFAIADYEDRKIDIVEQAYFESDYREYEVEELEIQLAKIYEEQLPIENAQKAEPESRPMSELLKIVEQRLVDLDE